MMFPFNGLTVDRYKVSEITGGPVNFFLDAGVENAQRQYILLGTSSGTVPGIYLSGGQVILPVNWDLFTNIVMNLMNTPAFDHFLGPLDKNGLATATMNLGSIPGAAGLTLNFAYALNKPWDWVSNPVAIEVVE